MDQCAATGPGLSFTTLGSDKISALNDVCTMLTLVLGKTWCSQAQRWPLGLGQFWVHCYLGTYASQPIEGSLIWMKWITTDKLVMCHTCVKRRNTKSSSKLMSRFLLHQERAALSRSHFLLNLGDLYNAETLRFCISITLRAISQSGVTIPKIPHLEFSKGAVVFLM